MIIDGAFGVISVPCFVTLPASLLLLLPREITTVKIEVVAVTSSDRSLRTLSRDRERTVLHGVISPWQRKGWRRERLLGGHSPW